MLSHSFEKPFCEPRCADAASDGLSPRELETLEHLRTGASTQEIAALMGVGLATIRSHLRNSFKKLDVHSRPQAVMAVTTPEGGDSELVQISPHVVDLLANRELETLMHLCTGQSTEQIALDMDLAITTVRTHTRNVYRKLGVHTRIEAIATATIQPDATMVGG